MSTSRAAKTVTPAVDSAPRRKGSVTSRSQELIGPFSLYLPTGRIEDGVEVQEEWTDAAGNKQQRAEREKESFSDGIWFRKNYLTAQMEDELRSVRMSDEFSEVMEVPTGDVEVVPGEFETFEEEKDGETVKVTRPKTKPILEKRRITTRRLNATIRTLVRVVGKWDLTYVVDGKDVEIPITVEGVVESGMDATLIYAILGLHSEATSPPPVSSAK